jgi:hypothetical protein
LTGQLVGPAVLARMSHMVGSYTASLVALAVARESAPRMLPDGLGLCHQEETPAGTHPVILMFGRQERVRIDGFDVLGAMAYHESIATVPFVRRVDASAATVIGASRSGLRSSGAPAVATSC